MGVTYADVLARNVRAARARGALEQELLAARMRSLGYSAWRRQTVASVEKGKRRLSAEEIFGLALALETNISSLLLPVPEDGPVVLPSGEELDRLDVSAMVLAADRRPVSWKDDEPVFTSRPPDAPIAANWLLPRLADESS